LAAADRLTFIWAMPCFESFLLRHLPACQTLRPMTCANALVALRHRWPTYSKPMSRTGLAPHIGRTQIRLAATVEADLSAFLRAINFR
jgi:hypothetical protein